MNFLVTPNELLSSVHVLTIAICLLLIPSIIVNGWDYSNNGRNWKWHCGGKMQSPVDLTNTKHNGSADILHLNYAGSDSSTRMYLMNDGHTIKILVKSPASVPHPFMTGALLPRGSRYSLESVSLHWESEHTLNGEHADLELQLVHRNIRYSSVTRALHKPNGLVILSVLYISDKNKASKISTFRLKKEITGTVLDGLTKVSQFSPSWSPLTSFKPYDLVPTSLGFYQYQGSLSEPPCTEHVTWIVMDRLGVVNHDLLAALGNVSSKTEVKMSSNRREITPRNSREIYRSTRVKLHDAAPTTTGTGKQLAAGSTTSFLVLVIISAISRKYSQFFL